MYTIGNLGSWETIPSIAVAVYDEDYTMLDSKLKKGLNLEKEISIGKYNEKLTPLEIALYCNNLQMISWLIENGAVIQTINRSSILLAVRHCTPKIVKFIIDKGGLQGLSEKQCGAIFAQMEYGNRFENIEVVQEAGVLISKYGGEAFRSLVSSGNMKYAKVFYDYEVDINFHKPNMVFPYATTPIIEAARNNNFPMVKWLVECGADIRLTDNYGDRPYTLSVKNGNMKMSEYLKALEPAAWHNAQNKLQQLKSYKLPPTMIDFLKSDNLQFDFSETSSSKYIRFYSLIDTVEMKWKGKKVLSLVADVENYELMIVWYPRDKAIYYIDPEHEEFCKLGDWNTFIANVEDFMNRILNLA